MFDDAYAKARELALEKGYVFVHPFDDPLIIAGAGTLGIEMLEDAPDLDTIVVPIGGGGLMSGVAIAARALKPDIELIGVEAELYPSMKCAIQSCQMPLGGDTLAEGIAVKQPGELTSRILRDNRVSVALVSERDLERAVAMLVGIEKTVVEGAGAAGLAAMLADRERFAGMKVATILCGGNIDTHRLANDVVLVSERDLERAVAMLVGIEKTVVEGAGAAGLAAMLADPERYRGKKVATVLCGGNIDTHLLANVLVRDLVRQGRIARLQVAAQDQPGALAAITAKVYEAGVNIIEINHSRIFTRLPAKDTVIEVECEARDAASIDDVVTRLEAAGFEVERASLD
jgi:threonine dehydratase